MDYELTPRTRYEIGRAKAAIARHNKGLRSTTLLFATLAVVGILVAFLYGNPEPEPTLKESLLFFLATVVIVVSPSLPLLLAMHALGEARFTCPSCSTNYHPTAAVKNPPHSPARSVPR